MMQQPSGGVVPADQQPQQQYQQQPPQQWMMMPPQQQHQAAAAAQAGWAQQQAAMQQQQQPQQYTAAAASQGSDEIRSLWIGDLLPWMDENYILNCFGPTGEAVNAKVIRNKQTGLPEGYGFIEFRTRSAAEQVLQNYNGTVMPSTEQNFRLNWATLGAGERRQDDGPDYTVFVGDLAADVTDYTLQETFRAHYHSVKGAKVVTDRTTGRSKGYGFVRFGDESEQLRAMNEMNGQFCSSRPMRIGPAATKKPVGGGQPYQKAAYPSSQGNPGEADPNNTTIFVGGLDPSVDDEMLRQSFGMFGELVHVKIPVGKRCGFVQFANRACAEQALSVMNGRVVGSQSVRLSWGRSPSSKQNQPEQTQWNGAGGAGFYQYPQGYDAYTYAPPTQDPNLYYGGYAGYGNYQQPGAAYQQQQQ
ncbi:putative nucleotide-binding alpha-beta plait domain-containing protein [Rosa chinensis]|uniref:Putative nucleotide-binding alpha-beta plait domain-containing protein n=1 Tax=Rosa chinensis TaxID=74649 RepID=A0A2P6QC76_ROSCH|nr:polyadenylate-binding protein RBP45C [Rosa chinensis]PRQ31785.1 putative nucleotide-binding alpha-beta plait domain-containing protein [Rosa chinensis]